MTRSRRLFLIVSLAVVAPLLGGVLWSQQQEDPGEDSLYRHLSVFADVLGLVRQAYVDEVPAEGLMGAALDSAPGALDPFSTYVPPGEVARWTAARRIGSRHSGLHLARQDGALYVLGVTAGSPAAAAGIEPGDLIAKIDGQSTRRLPLWRAEQVFAAEVGARVRIESFRRGERRELEVALAAFPAPGVERQRVEGLELLRLPDTREDLVAPLRGSLEELAATGRQGLLIDLRGVYGTDPEAAYALAALFADGPLGGLQRREEVERRFRGAAPVWQGSIVVLVDAATAGGAEVLASVLRQAAGAELVGRSTFGHAGRLGEVTISNGGRLVLTTGYYSGPDGEALDRSLEPDTSITAQDRRFADQDLEVDDLILRRGIARLQARLQAT